MAEPIILIMDGGDLWKVVTRSGVLPAPVVTVDWTDIDPDEPGAIWACEMDDPDVDSEPAWIGLMSCERASERLAWVVDSVVATGLDSNAKDAADKARMAAQTEGGPSFT